MSRSDKAARDAAFADFVTRSTPSLLRTAWLLTGSHDAAHELVQGALVKTYVVWSRVHEDEALPYARRILINHRTDTWRKTRGEHPVAEPPERPHHDGTTADDRDRVVRMLAALPDQQRRVVVLRYYNDLSEHAVADLLGISVGSVKSAASRGLATLRASYPTNESTTEGSLR
ncbi:SigE family RNA polymerase sigma factor [Phycicoccus sp. Root101]|uniref:SigE family RNA polymerase sigma factor n=1 Tax=Phycicoccus sp. Root101 TaxID=1736421 RepID=UPI000703619F|nr:SigE family RNA polymerase sigma factor [Phycicoccus sp. Root101]KQU70815.1 RNA polymerase [Phycicoccus sp. Root101]